MFLSKSCIMKYKVFDDFKKGKVMADKVRRSREDAGARKKAKKRNSEKRNTRVRDAEDIYFEDDDYRVKKNGNRQNSKSKSRNSSAGKKGKRRKSGMALGTKIALGLCGVLLAFVLAAIGVLASKMGKIKTEQLDPDKLSISDELTYDETGYLNVALFGLDKRENNEEMGTRSDSIMIASLNRETKEIKISSVYRDTLLQQDDGTYNKANAAYSFGEETEAIAMLNRNLDMDIQRYVTVDFSALVDVIDALGGVEIDVTEEEIEYINGYGTEITANTGVTTPMVVSPGLQTLNGVQATAYTRIRYTAGDDFKRAERQRTVLTKIAEKAQEASLSSLNKIIDRVFPKVKTNFTLAEILAYAKDVKKYKLGETTGFPFDKDTMDYGDAGNVVYAIGLEDNVIELHEYFFGDDGYKPSSTVKDISDEIAYISGTSGSTGTGTGGYSGDTGGDSYYYDYGTYDDTTQNYNYGTDSNDYNQSSGNGTGYGYDGNTGYSNGTGDPGAGDFGTGEIEY